MANKAEAAQVYSFIQFAGWSIVLIISIMRLFEGVKDIYPYVSYYLKPIQLLQLIEFIFSVSGVTKTHTLSTAFQYLGRIFVVFFVMEVNPSLKSNSVIVLCWAIGEVTR